MAKKQFSIYKLHFTSPLHISDSHDDYGISLQMVHSDTMYAAITSCLTKKGTTIPENGDLGCTISSLFPFYQKEPASNTILFFPKPFSSSNPRLKDVADAKKVKKVAWLDQTFFERAISGETLFDNSSDIESIQGKYLSKSIINEEFLSSQLMNRVAVSRDGLDDAIPFYMDKVTFRDYSGLYFLCDGDTRLIDEGLNLLQWEGIGTDRNVGNGFFEYSKDNLELCIPDVANHVIALSLFIPEDKEQLLKMTSGEKVAYDFQRRGGWITTPPNTTLRKNAIYGYVAGSVFSALGEGCYSSGRIVDLRPSIPTVQHPIWRCGRSLFLPLK